MAEMASMYVFDTAMPMISFNFGGCCVHDVRRIWISFRHHPHDAAFGLLFAMTGSCVPEYTSSIGSWRHDIFISVHFCKRRKVLEMAVTSRNQFMIPSGILLTKTQDPASRWSF